MRIKPLKRFHDCNEAVQFAYAWQKKNRKQQHVFVHVTNGAVNRGQRCVVRSSDDIAAIDTKHEAERCEIEQKKARLENEKKARYPELELLKKTFGPFRAWQMADQLADMREKGRDYVAKTMPKST